MPVIRSDLLGRHLAPAQGHCQEAAALGTPGLEHVAAIGALHPLAKTMDTQPATHLGLPCSFGHDLCSSGLSERPLTSGIGSF